MTKLPGKRDGSSIYFDEETFFCYTISSKKKNVNYMKCSNTKCTGRAKMEKENGGNGNGDEGAKWKIIQTKGHNHNHDPDPLFKEVSRLRRSIILRCATENMDHQQIFDEECKKVSEEVAAKLSLSSLTSAIYRAKKDHLPSIPDNIHEFEEILQPYLQRFGLFQGQHFYEKTLGDANDKKIIVFVVRPLLDVLQNIDEIHVDGTFQTIPLKPKFSQLFTVMCIASDHAFPLVYALMEDKSFASYKILFEFLRDNNDLQLRPKIIISNFEKAIDKAIEKTFLDFGINVQHIGCWHHLGRAIFKKINKKNLRRLYIIDENFHHGVTMLTMLAFLPPEKIIEGYNVIEIFFEMNNLKQKALPIMKYFQKQWIQKIKPEKWSVINCAPRTNNPQELFRSLLLKTFDSEHPNIWRFIEGLQKISRAAVRDCKEVKNGKLVSWPVKKNLLPNDAEIRAQTELLHEGEISVLEFLESVSSLVAQPEYGSDEEEILASNNVPELSIYLPWFRTPNYLQNGEKIPPAVIAWQKEKILHHLNEKNEGVRKVEEGDIKCVVCMENAATRMARPCYQRVTCHKCSIELTSTTKNNQNGDLMPVTCPICRALIYELVHFF